jgi:Leucine-rich repeat (LRR) protein
MEALKKLRAKKRPDCPKDFKGVPFLTEQFIMDLCEYKGFPSHIIFITKLELSHIGVENMQHLDTFTEIEILEMQRNRISYIQNIDHMKALKFINLSMNNIE